MVWRLLIVVLALGVSAGACPSRTGFIAGGLMSQPASLQALCPGPRGLFDRMIAEMDEEVRLAANRGHVSSVRWQEFFTATPANARAVMDHVGAGLHRARYVLLEQERSPDGRTHHLWYATPGRRAQLIVSYVLSGGRLHVGFIGLRH